MSTCAKCHNTGWTGFHKFYADSQKPCSCPAGQEVAKWAAMTVEQQNAKAAEQAVRFRAEASAARKARRAAQ